MAFSDNREIVLSENGVQIKDEDDESIVKKTTSDYVDYESKS